MSKKNRREHNEEEEKDEQFFQEMFHLKTKKKIQQNMHLQTIEEDDEQHHSNTQKHEEDSSASLSLLTTVDPNEKKDTALSNLFSCILTPFCFEKKDQTKEMKEEIPFQTFSETWGVDLQTLLRVHEELVSKLRKSVTDPHYIMFLFCMSKGIDEDRFRSLFFQATEKCSVHVETPHLQSRSLLHFTDWWLNSTNIIALEAQTTLAELLTPSLQVCETPYEISFDCFCSKHPEWLASSSCWVFWRDHPAVYKKEGILIQRRQLSGNCYIISPIVWHHYRYQMEPDSLAGQLAYDIRGFILKQLTCEDLSKLICRVGGGSSRKIAKMLLGEEADLFSVASEDALVENLHRYGPSLVTGFQLESRFRNAEECEYRGKVEGLIDGTHSMVIVGYRVNDNAVDVRNGNKFMFLLQNWWVKQFVVCSWSYLESSSATLLFTRQKKVSIPVLASTTIAEYAEAAGCDGDDLAPEEHRPNSTLQ